MKKPEVLNKMTRAFHSVGFEMKKHSPELLVVAGIGGVVVAAVMACKATRKLDGVLEETKDQLDTIKALKELPAEELAEGEAPMTEQESKKAMTVVYAKSALEMTKLYGPSVAVGAVSITAILAGHNILHKRNVALATTLTAVETSFKQYRGRVIERFGKELDKELRFNTKVKEIEEKVVNEDGSETVTTKTVETVNPNEVYSPYTFCFDVGCNGWTKNPAYNRMFLEHQQAMMTQRLEAQGYLFLNDVLKELGLPQTEVGQIAGWIYDEESPIGDNYVDFGIFDIHKPANRDFVNGYEASVWLDFNCVGNILKYTPLAGVR